MNIGFIKETIREKENHKLDKLDQYMLLVSLQKSLKIEVSCF